MRKLGDFIRRHKLLYLAVQMIVCACIFGVIYFGQRGIRDINLADAERKGGYARKDGGIHIDETDGAYGLYMDVFTDEIKKGWYKVHVEYETGYDDNGFLIKPLNENPYAINNDVGDETGTIALRSQHKEKEVHIWAEEPTVLQISFHFCGGGYLDINGIKLERVANYTPLFSVVFLFIMIDVVLWEVIHIDLQERRRKNFIRGGILFIAAIACVPLMNRYILTGFDLIFHLHRIEGIAEGLRSGQFPVRIMPQWWNEYGYGAPMFYGDIFLYFPAVLLLLNYKLQTALKCYIAFINLLTAWICYKSFFKISKDEKIALLGAAFYTLNIFRLMNLYCNNGVGTYTAMAFLPLILAGFYCIEEKDGWLYLTLGLSGCICSHLMTCEMAGVFIILFLLLSIKWFCQKKVFLNLCKAGAMTLLWNLWFLVPFLNLYFGEYKFKHMDNFQTNIQQNGIHFGDGIRAVFASLGGETDIYRLGRTIGLTATVGLLFVIAAIILKIREEQREIRQIVISAGAFLGASFVSLILCTKYFPYDFLCKKSETLATLIHILQFPFRFLEMAVIFSIAAIIFGLMMWKRLQYKKAYIIMGSVLGGICLLETAFYYQRLLIESPQTAMICEYYALPVYMETKEYLPTEAENFYEMHRLNTSGDMVKIENYEKEYTSIAMLCANEGEQEGYVDVPLFYYPCYKARDEMTGARLALTYGENARVRIILPPGYSGKIVLGVSERKLWRLAELISVLSLAAALYIAVKRQTIENMIERIKKGKQNV